MQPHNVIKDETRRPLPQAAEIALPDGAVAINGVKPRESVRGIRSAGDKLAMLEGIPGAAAAPILTGSALLRFGARDVTITVTGIDPERYRRVANLEKDMRQGRLDDLTRSWTKDVEARGGRLVRAVTSDDPTAVTRAVIRAIAEAHA